MSFQVYIVRQNDYQDFEEASNISLKEWIEYIKSDSELTLESGYEISAPIFLNPEDIVPLDEESSISCAWMGHPRSDCDTIPVFYFENGRIYTGTLDDPTLGKLFKIATDLKARVRSDDELYYDDSYFSNGNNPVSE